MQQPHSHLHGYEQPQKSTAFPAISAAYGFSVIERAGGFVAKYIGDGVLAYFGYPRADEHDAERAVRAGLGLAEAVPGLDTAAGAPLQVRIGIATGLVVVGDLIGEGAAQEQAVVGETPNFAARLQALAEPGTVVIGPSTRRLTAGLFDYADLGPVEIKGLAAPVTASRVLRQSAAESRFAALRTTSTPLVGRDEELALLQRRWQQAKSGKGSVVLVSGEPGHRQVPARADPARAAERRAAHPLTPVLLAAPPGPSPLPDDHPARTGGRVSARGHRRAAARQARGGARAGDQ
jgi:hypothetical protein